MFVFNFNVEINLQSWVSEVKFLKCSFLSWLSEVKFLNLHVCFSL